MTFSIFHKTGEMHFDHNGIDDYDGDEGYYDDIEITDEQVHNDIAEMVYKAYIRDGLLMKKVPSEVREQLIDRVKLLLDDLDIWDKLEEDYRDELQEKYQEEYGND